MAFHINPGEGACDSIISDGFSSNNQRLIAHGFDGSGCSYEIDGCIDSDFVDSGLPETIAPFSFEESQVCASSAQARQLNSSDPYENASAVETCTQRLKFIHFQPEITHSIISDDSGFNSVSCVSSTYNTTSLSLNSMQNDCQNASRYNDLDPRESYVDEDGDSFLHMAIVQEREDIVHDILQHNLPDDYINIKDAQSRTALQLATLSNQPSLIKILVENGANLFSMDTNGENALHIAASNGFLTCVKILVTLTTFLHNKTSYCPDVRNFRGFSALHLAAAGRHYDVISFLVYYFNADVNCGDGCSGRTILHHAADSGDLDMVTFLVNQFRCRLNINVLSHDQRTTPMALAVGRNHWEIVRILENLGGQSPCDCLNEISSDSDNDS